MDPARSRWWIGDVSTKPEICVQIDNLTAETRTLDCTIDVTTGGGMVINVRSLVESTGSLDTDRATIFS